MNRSRCLLSARALSSLVLAAAVAQSAQAQTGQAPSLTYGAASSSVGIQWSSDFEAATAQAQSEGKLVLLHFWTTTCGPCRVLDSQVFNQPAVASAVHSGFVPVKVDANQSASLAQRFGITQVPTDVIVDAQGRVVDRMVSPSSPMAYVSRVRQAVAKSAAKPGADFQLAAAQSPYRQQVNNAYAGLNIPQTSQPAAAQAASMPQATSNPYAAPADRYAPTAVKPPTAPPVNPPTAQPQVNPYAAQPPAAQPPAAQPSVSGPPVAQPPVAQRPADHRPAVRPAAPPVVARTPAVPPGSPPLGLEGFCPVSMKRMQRWVKGNPQWGVLHQGRTYLFAGQAERDTFLRSPDVFSPVLSGVDPVALLETGRQVPGKREFGLEYANTVYLFSSEASLKQFCASPDRYAAGVRQAMSTGRGATIR